MTGSVDDVDVAFMREALAQAALAEAAGEVPIGARRRTRKFSRCAKRPRR
jgi:tRNA(Arg) A34 adenosine deaminase TadA